MHGVPAALPSREEKQCWKVLGRLQSLKLSAFISESRPLSPLCLPQISVILILNRISIFKGYPNAIRIILAFLCSFYLKIKVLIVIDISASRAKRVTYKGSLNRKNLEPEIQISTLIILYI